MAEHNDGNRGGKARDNTGGRSSEEPLSAAPATRAAILADSAPGKMTVSRMAIVLRVRAGISAAMRKQRA